MPDFTIASAVCRSNSSLTLQANLFQLFHPIGGVRASVPAYGEGFGATSSSALATEQTMSSDSAMTTGFIILIFVIPRRCSWIGRSRSDVSSSARILAFVALDTLFLLRRCAHKPLLRDNPL